MKRNNAGVGGRGQTPPTTVRYNLINISNLNFDLRPRSLFTHPISLFFSARFETRNNFSSLVLNL